MSESIVEQRKPWVGLALSLVVPGLGHLYCGRPLKGALLAMASSLLMPVWIVTAFFQPSTPLLAFQLSLTATVIAVHLFAPVDAYRLACQEGTRYQLRSFNRVAVYALFFVLGWALPSGVAHYVKELGFQAFYIPGTSMYPNLRKGDYLLVNKRLFDNRAPRPGDVVVFRDPANAQQWLVKRVVAEPGDAVEIRTGRIYINGTPLDYREAIGEERAKLAISDSETEGATVLYEQRDDDVYPIWIAPLQSRMDLVETRVPEGRFFLLGDNRSRSHDSRHFGAVAREDIVGAVHYIYLPGGFAWHRFGAFAGSRL